MPENPWMDRLKRLVEEADHGMLGRRGVMSRLEELYFELQGAEDKVPGGTRGERLQPLLTNGANGRNRAEEINHALFRISNAVNTTHDLNDLYVSIHRALARIIDVTNFFIGLHDAERGILFFPHHADEMDDDFGEVPVDFDSINSLSAQVFIERKAVLFQEADLLERKASNRVQGPLPVVWLGVPLMVKNKVIGVMAVQSYTDPHRYDAKDAEVLNSVSDQVAVAIERKQAEEALNQSEKRFREMADFLPTGVCEVDLEAAVRYMNRKGLEMFGLDSDTVDRRISFLNLVHPSDRIRAERFFKDVAESRSAGSIELAFFSGTGSSIAALVHASPIVADGASTGVRISITDLTGRKRLEAELQKAYKMETIGTLGGGIAHDFNNILAAIMGALSLAKDARLPGDDIRHYLARAEEATLTARDLVQRFITFSDGWQPSMSRTSIGELIEHSLRFVLEGSPVTCRASIPDGLWPVEVDRTQLSRALNNLIMNAGEAMAGRGGIEIQAENMTLPAQNGLSDLPLPEGPYVKVVIRDHGPGIPSEHLPFVFDPYFSTKERGSQKGMGLGLTLAYSIVQKHRGLLEAASTPGDGAAFTLYLPAFPSDPQ